MNQHPYLRAYMAGIAFPTAFLLIGLTLFCIGRFVLNVPAPIERVIAFPMAIIPNIFGAWNMLFIKLHRHWRLSIGLHGAALPFVLGPIGVSFGIFMGVLRLTGRDLIYFGIIRIPYWSLILAPFLVIAIYYLIWKYVVGFLNQVLEVHQG